MTKPPGAFLEMQVNSTRLQNSPQRISILLLPSSTAASTHWLSISAPMPLLMLSIDVMLAQLPPHTVAKKVENYEHLDLLWGQDVDKVVFPHVLDFLKLYAEPVEGSKTLEAQSSHDTNASSPPAYSTSQSAELRKRGETARREPGVSYVQATGGHHSQSEGAARLSYAKVTDSSETDRTGESDSDETMGDDHATVKPNVSYASAAKGSASPPSSHWKSTSFGEVSTSSDEPAPGTDKPVTSEISYADMAAK
jgi:hypothetical protein